MTGAALALSAVATYMSYEGEIKAASQQEREAERQAAAAKEREERDLRIQQEKIEYEAKLAAEQAEWETKISLEKAEFTRGQIQKEAQLIHGAQIAGYAASGIDVEKGSPLRVMAQTSQSAEAERQQVMRGHTIFAEAREKEAAEVSRGGAFTYKWFTERIHAETGYEVESRLSEAAAYRSQGQYAAYGQGLSIGASLLSGYNKL